MPQLLLVLSMIAIWLLAAAPADGCDHHLSTTIL
jgi:hypothetical protein